MAEAKERELASLTAGYGVIQLKSDQVLVDWNEELEEEINEKRKVDRFSQATTVPKTDVCLRVTHSLTL